MNADTTLSLIIPVQNDEASLPLLVHEALAILPTYAADFEIILVDAGRHDATMQAAVQLAAENEPVVVLHSPRQGYGAALIHAFRAARGEYLLVMDADRRMTISDIARFAPHIGEGGIVLGYRTVIEASTGQARGKLLKLYQWLFDLDVRDPLCGFKLLNANLLRSLDLQTTSALLSIEILAKARLQGASIVEVPIHAYTAEDELAITVADVWQLWRVVRGYQPPNRVSQRREWRQRALVGSALAALLGGVYMLRRRR